MSAEKTFVLLLSLVASGCASIGEVREENRDPSNSFDGDWIAKAETTNNLQIYRSWQFTCVQFEAPLALVIQSSSVSVTLNEISLAPQNRTYISSNGSFKASLPTGIKSGTTQSSDVIHSDVDVRLIVKGKLGSDGHGKGKVTIGYAVANYQGCTTNLVFSKE